MLKLTVAVLAFALASSAAAGWHDLRVDGSNDEAFTQSMAAFKKELSPAREYVFGEALKDIWIQSATAAEAEQRDYTADEYYGLLDGLSYDDVVNYTDPTGDTAKERYRNAKGFRSRSSGVRQVQPASDGYRYRDTSAEYWTLFGGGGAGPPRGSPSLQGIPGQR